MAEKELRKMSRSELVDIIYALKNDEELLEQERNSLQEALENRRIEIENAGSIAEAALSLNRVFASAQQAADDYVLSAKKMSEETEMKRQTILREAQEEKKKILEEAGREAALILSRAQKKADDIIDEACREAVYIKAAEEKQDVTEAQKEENADADDVLIIREEDPA